MTKEERLQKMRELMELANAAGAGFRFPEIFEKMMKELTKEYIQVQYLLIQCKDADRDEWRKIALSWVRRAIQAEEKLQGLHKKAFAAGRAAVTREICAGLRSEEARLRAMMGDSSFRAHCTADAAKDIADALERGDYEEKSDG